MVNGIILDVDGTILDSMGIWDNAGTIYLKNFGIQAERNLGNILFSMSMTEGAEYLKNTYGLVQTTEEIIAGINNTVFDFYEKHVQLKDGILLFLQFAKKKRIPMSIATTSDRTVIMAAFQRLALKQYFVDIVTASEVGKGKEEPDIYFAAAKHMGNDIKNIWVIEDAFHAIQTAKKAGFQVAGIYDDSSRELQEKIRRCSDFYLESWSEWEALAAEIIR